MFSSGPNYTKLKTNLRLTLNRLKLLEKKKAELAQKARKEIADYLIANKVERARIRVEHIIREDYLVEAMEIVEMYCDMILARFGLVTQMKELDVGIAEPVYSLVWVCPRLQSDVPELAIINEIFAKKYGPQFAENARNASGEHQVSEKLLNKLTLQAPPKLLVEKYLIEIAKIYNVEYTPDPQVMQEANKTDPLIDLSDVNNLGGSGGGGGFAPPQMGFIGYPAVPPLPEMSNTDMNKKLFNYPPPFNTGSGGSAGGFINTNDAANSSTSSGAAASNASGYTPFAYNIPPSVNKTNNSEANDLNTNFINLETNNFTAAGGGGANAGKAEEATNSSPDENILRPKLHEDPPPRYSSINPMNLKESNIPKPQPRMKMPPAATKTDDILPNLPAVPNDLPEGYSTGQEPENDDEIDFEDLSRRFENLKKRPFF